MAAHTSREVRRFALAAAQRLREAQFLLEHDFTTAAVYLAGYAVECALKALILLHERAAEHVATLDSFRGTKAHEFEWLRKVLSRRKVVIPVPIRECLNELNWWTTDLRYIARKIDRKRAEAFLRGTEAWMRWVQGRL